MQDYFKNKQPIIQKLLDFGFAETDEKFEYFCPLDIDSLILNVSIFSSNVLASVIDKALGEEYYLWKTEADDPYANKVRNEVEEKLAQIANSCFIFSPFGQNQSKLIVDYISKKYAVKPEYLWKKFPSFCIFRRPDNQKWFCAFMVVEASKLGFENDDLIEIINLKAEKGKMGDILQLSGCYPGWHMNKKSWFSVVLDGSLSDEELLKLIDISHNLAK